MQTASPGEHGLEYFTHEIGGVRYGGWYRMLDADCIEIRAVGLIAAMALKGRSAYAAACEALDDLVCIRQRIEPPLLDVGQTSDDQSDIASIPTVPNSPGTYSSEFMRVLSRRPDDTAER